MGRAAIGTGNLLGPTALTYGATDYLYDDPSVAAGATMVPLSAQLAGMMTRYGMRAMPGSAAPRAEQARTDLQGMRQEGDAALAHETTGTDAERGYQIDPQLQARLDAMEAASTEAPVAPEPFTPAERLTGVKATREGLTGNDRLRTQYDRLGQTLAGTRAKLREARAHLESFGHPDVILPERLADYEAAQARVEQLAGTERALATQRSTIARQGRDLYGARMDAEDAAGQQAADVAQGEFDVAQAEYEAAQAAQAQARADLDTEAAGVFQNRSELQGEDGANVSDALARLDTANQDAAGRARAEKMTRDARWAGAGAGLVTPALLGEETTADLPGAMYETAVPETVREGIDSGIEAIGDQGAGMTSEDMARIGKVVAGVGATAVLGFLAYKLLSSDDDDDKKKSRRGRPPGSGRGRGRPRKTVMT